MLNIWTLLSPIRNIECADGSSSRRLDDVAGHQPKDDHDSVDEVLSGGAAVLLPAHGRQDEEDRQPDHQFVPGEHPERTQQQ